MTSFKISKDTFKFLENLKQNNNRDWFNSNKTHYEKIKEEFEAFVNGIIMEMAVFDKSIAHNEAKKSIFRIYRDVRFSKDKSPYKVHLGAHITPSHNKSINNPGAGYYIHIEPGASMLAGGAYQPQPIWLKNIREEIDYNSNDFKKITEQKEFKKYFGRVEGEKLIRPPKGYAADHPEIEILKHKSYIATHQVPDQQVVSNNFFEHTIEVFKVLQPFNAFLNKGLDSL